MKILRRNVLRLAAGAAALPALYGVMGARARADTYPSRPVHVLLGFAAGGASDVIGRLMSQWLSEKLGQPLVFDNRPGAASNIATELVAKESPDGYSLLWCTSANTNNATLYQNLNFNFIRDFAPVGGTFRVPNVLEVHPSVPVATVPEFIAYAKANPGRLNFASGGIGATQHMAAELFMFTTGVEMRHVPYRGSAPALADLMGGQIDFVFDGVSTSLGYAKSGMVGMLGVTTLTRTPVLPEAPTIAESGLPGFDITVWFGLFAPAGTPKPIVDKINSKMNEVLAEPDVKESFAKLGFEPGGGSPDALAQRADTEIKKWANIVREKNIHVDP